MSEGRVCKAAGGVIPITLDLLPKVAARAC